MLARGGEHRTWEPVGDLEDTDMKLTYLVVLLAAFAVTGTTQAQRHEINQAVASACKTELEQLCKGQKGKEAEQCLKSNSAKLSSDCKGAVSKAPPAKS